MTILALDISSTRTGWAYFKAGKLVASGSWKLDRDPINKRPFYLYEMIQLLPEVIQELLPFSRYDVMVIEDAYNSKNPDSYKKLARMQGAAMATARPSQTQIEFITPQEWRRWLLGKGKAGGTRKAIKAKVQKILKVLGCKFENDDEADAIGIGLGYIERERTNRKKQEWRKK